MVNWDAPTEAKLFAAIFVVCGIKPNGVQLKEIAAMISPDCTPKAITHRLAKLRNGDGGAAKTLGTPTKLSTTSATTPKLSAKKGTAKATKKGSAKPKGKSLLSKDSEDDDEEEEATGNADSAPASGRKTSPRKGTKRNYAETDGSEDDDEDGETYVHQGKKIKTEAGMFGDGDGEEQVALSSLPLAMGGGIAEFESGLDGLGEFF